MGFVLDIRVPAAPAVLPRRRRGRDGGLDEDFRYLEWRGLAPVRRRFRVILELFVNVCNTKGNIE